MQMKSMKAFNKSKNYCPKSIKNYRKLHSNYRGTPKENDQLLNELKQIENEKVLLIDRDGTLVIEPPVDYQLDSLEKLEFYPGVFQGLSKIAKELDYELVMVTNQDGLGTESFPEDTFWPAQNKIINAFKKEGVIFSEVLIDKSFPEDNAPTRKPRTGLLNKYIYGDYDPLEAHSSSVTVKQTCSLLKTLALKVSLLEIAAL